MGISPKSVLSYVTSHVEGALSELMYYDTYNILMNGQLWSFSVRENTRTFPPPPPKKIHCRDRDKKIKHVSKRKISDILG